MEAGRRCIESIEFRSKEKLRTDVKGAVHESEACGQPIQSLPLSLLSFQIGTWNNDLRDGPIDYLEKNMRRQQGQKLARGSLWGVARRGVHLVKNHGLGRGRLAF